MNNKKFRYFLLITILIYILSGNFVLANSIGNEKIESGFYINGTTDNLYFDIYTYLNNQKEAALAITNAGLNNIIFVHQNGKGFTLGELINSPSDYNVDDLLRTLTKYDFEEVYIDFSSREEILINPNTLINALKINPSYYLMKEIPNEFMDVLEREYPEFLRNIKEAWVNSEDDDSTKDDKILSFLEDVKIEIEKNGNITEKNFNRMMYNALESVLFKRKHTDFRNAIFEAYGPQIDYSDEHKELHPDLIPLSEAIKGSVLNNHFTLLYDIDNGYLVEGDKLTEILKTKLNANDYIEYDVIENKNLNMESNVIFNRLVESKANTQINIYNIDGTEINPPKALNLMIEPYIDGPTIDITSTTSDYDELTRKVEVLDENGQVIEDTVEEVLIYNMTTGTIARQEIPNDQKISYLYISVHNPNMDYMIYFKTINKKWYKIRLTNYVPNRVLVNEYLELE